MNEYGGNNYGGAQGYGAPQGGGFGGAAAGIGAGIAGMFQKNPADSAMQYYNQIPGMMGNIYQPYMNNANTAFGNLNQYMNNGVNAGHTLSQQLNMMATNPSAVMNQMGSSFHQSPGYQWNVNQALSAANRAAAAGGMAGSPAEQYSLAQNVTGMANQDYYNYLNHSMNMFQNGLSGLQSMYNTGANVGNNIYETGAQMANEYGENMAQAMMNQGNLAYAGQINQNQAQQGGWGALAGGAADAAAMF